MNPTPHEICDLIVTRQLGKALRGELCVFTTPDHLNDDMRPTDHAELLATGLYPLVVQYGADVVRKELEAALAAICVDALGVFCAHQCYYVQIVMERAMQSPIAIDRAALPKILGRAFLREVPGLHRLELRKGDVLLDRSYKVVLCGMQILARDDCIDWGAVLP